MNNLRYWHDCLKDYVQNKQEYFVKYDPHNPNHAFIFLNGQWQKLYCTSPIVKEYNESKIDNSFIELMARAAIISSDYRSVPEFYARFLMNCKKNEDLMASNLNLIKSCDRPSEEESISDIHAGGDTYQFERFSSALVREDLS